MATGFNNTPSASEFRNHSSWGRTRQPKNIAGANGARIVHGGAANGAPTTVTDGFPTENQRYLHWRWRHDALPGRTITVWAWYHAFQKWVPLVDASGTAVTLTIGGEVGKVKSRIDEIWGVDRVYFEISATIPDTDPLHAACSTF